MRQNNAGTRGHRRTKIPELKSRRSSYGGKAEWKNARSRILRGACHRCLADTLTYCVTKASRNRQGFKSSVSPARFRSYCTGLLDSLREGLRAEWVRRGCDITEADVIGFID